MKKVFILLATSIFTIGAYAQQVPNGGFENWNDSINPIGWNTLANGFGPQYSYFAKKDTNAMTHVEGLASLMMKTDSVFVPSASILRSFVGLGTINVAQGAPVFSGTPFSRKPDTLYMAYAYIPGAGADSATVQINLRQGSTSLFTAGTKLFYLPPAPQGGFLAFPLTGLYSGTGTPDTLNIVFKSGKSSTGTEYGSTLWVDDVHFNDTVAVVNGINDIRTAAAVNAYPNPANNTINVVVAQSETGSTIQMADLTGRVVYTGILSNISNAIDVANLPTGIYAISIRSNDHLTIYKGKISVAH